MVFSYYLYKYPYQLTWNTLNTLKKREEVIFYAEDLLDLVIFKPVQSYIKTLPIVVKNKKIKANISLVSAVQGTLPYFPKALIMCRHACHKFPEKKILKFGLRHGAYHFKKLTNASNYNAFTKYFVTSQNEVDIARKCGIYSTVAVGYPKLDPAFNGEISEQHLQKLSQSLNFSAHKKNVLFTATWDKSGMSAIDAWIHRLDEITENYNVMVTVHPWTSKHYKTKLLKNRNIQFISHPDILPYLMLADCVVGDTSSIIAEACALDKSILTFKTGQAKRSLSEIEQLIKSISFQIDIQDDFFKNLEYAVAHSFEHHTQRHLANQIMFDTLDGKAGERAAKIILEYLPELMI